MKDRILGLMRVRGITPEEMANHMGIAVSTFYKRLKAPEELTYGNLIDMADLIGLPIGELIRKEKERC